MAAPLRKEEYRESIKNKDGGNFPRQRVIKDNTRGHPWRKDDGIRNVKSTMPGSPQSPNFTSSIPDTASNFRETYAKAGIQPANIDERPPAPRSSQAQMANRSAQVEYSNSQPMIAPGAKTFKLRKKQRKKNPGKAALAKARVTTANITIFSWGFWIWAFVQVPFAAISIVMFGLAQALHEIYKTFTFDGAGGDEGGWTSTLIGWATLVFDTIFDGVNWLLKTATGIDLKLFDPTTLYLITSIVLMALGMLTLFLIYMTYKVAFLRPLNGRGSGLKWLGFSIAVIGYGVGSLFPFFNLIPWFLFWTIPVWFYPK